MTSSWRGVRFIVGLLAKLAGPVARARVDAVGPKAGGTEQKTGRRDWHRRPRGRLRAGQQRAEIRQQRLHFRRVQYRRLDEKGGRSVRHQRRVALDPLLRLFADGEVRAAGRTARLEFGPSV